MSIKTAVLLHASVVEPDNSEGRPLQLLWEMFDLKIHFFERVLLKKLAEGQTPRKGKWGKPEWWSSKQ
ncbi:hypothetical protein GT022_10005 [Agaribacter marinus]|uniref:Uncharacterized protein n=1 Tax=Virgibacillus salarius TaxID=447199 RepID=A0A941DVQ7_9BACI|nr:hypothetical protein [Virgibacillus salarius]MBR7796372.1 hypothetical protein [Virgibacillus salarius]NAZ09081.1 hypothetical protein [Agaribacter marinus]